MPDAELKFPFLPVREENLQTGAFPRTLPDVIFLLENFRIDKEAFLLNGTPIASENASPLLRIQNDRRGRCPAEPELPTDANRYLPGKTAAFQSQTALLVPNRRKLHLPLLPVLAGMADAVPLQLHLHFPIQFRMQLHSAGNPFSLPVPEGGKKIHGGFRKHTFAPGVKFGKLFQGREQIGIDAFRRKRNIPADDASVVCNVPGHGGESSSVGARRPPPPVLSDIAENVILHPVDHRAVEKSVFRIVDLARQVVLVRIDGPGRIDHPGIHGKDRIRIAGAQSLGEGSSVRLVGKRIHSVRKICAVDPPATDFSSPAPHPFGMNGVPQSLELTETGIGSGKSFDLLIISAVRVAVPRRYGFQIPKRIKVESGRKRGGVDQKRNSVFGKSVGKIGNKVAPGAFRMIPAQPHNPVIGRIGRAVVAGILSDGQEGVPCAQFAQLLRNRMHIEPVDHPVPFVGRSRYPLTAVLRRMKRTARIEKMKEKSIFRLPKPFCPFQYVFHTKAFLLP